MLQMTFWSRLSIRRKLLLGGVTFQVVALLLMALGTLAVLERHLEDEIELRAKQVAPLLNAALRSPLVQRDYASVAAILSESCSPDDLVYVAVFDTAGRLVAEAREPGSSTVAGSRPQLPDSSSQEFAASIDMDGQALGQVRYALSRQHIERTRAMVLVGFGGLGLFALLVFVLLMYWFSGSLTRPLEELVKASIRIGAGDFRPGLERGRQDEVGNLIQAFEKMSADIELKVSELTAGEALQRQYLARAIEQQEALGVALREAKEANQVKSRFLSTMSHEIRTPLNTVIGLASLLGRQDLPETTLSQIATMQDASEHLLRMIDDVLDLGDLDRGDLALKSEPFSLKRLLINVLTITRSLPGTERLDIQSQFPPETALVLLGDVARLTQVLLYLTSNAVKFTRSGFVRFSVEIAERKVDAISLLFVVSDSGSGIALADQATIFEPFTQASDSALKPHAGAGLGLSVARRLVQRMGGDIEVQSEPGYGSRFAFELCFPLAPAKLPTGSPSEAPKAGSLHVLCAEDTPTSQLVLRKILQKLGHRVRMVDDGAQALQAVQEEDFDVVFLDFQMPVLDGLAAARAIRALGTRASQVPLIGLTAHAQAVDKENAIQSGINVNLTKPIRLDDIDRALRALAIRPHANPSDQRQTP